MSEPGSGGEGRRQPPREPMPPENRFAIVAGTICLIAGIVVLAVASGTGATIAGAMLIGLGGIAFVSLVFLIVGQSEEADRRRHPGG